ncbi:MAG: ATP synthase F1 subunit gamma [Clostridia bacterium]|nr:ATP synthase F1 subunit gamma [Clostridia bacterium]
MAGANLRDIRRRIRSVTSTEQITRAMKMVAAAQVRRAEERARAARPYAEAISEALAELTRRAGRLSHPFFLVRERKRPLYLVLTADRGLAGPYNAHVLRLAERTIAAGGGTPLVIAVGRKGRDFFQRRGWELLATFTEVGDHPTFAVAEAIARPAMDAFLAGRADSVTLVWNAFLATAQYEPRSRDLLPLAPTGREGEAKAEAPGPEVEFEPDAESVLGALLPHYVRAVVLGALLEAKAAEHGARMMAMDTASKNAEEMIEFLTLVRNRLRQAAITKEIADIVGGAEALKG